MDALFGGLWQRIRYSSTRLAAAIIGRLA
jgi:hypothetical protein